jgi:hypothetical protein
MAMGALCRQAGFSQWSRHQHEDARSWASVGTAGGVELARISPGSRADLAMGSC